MDAAWRTWMMETGVTVQLVVLAAMVCSVRAARHMHLGCYVTAPPGADIEGLKYQYARLQLQSCAEGCCAEGFPYLALRQGRHCLCVSDFGKGGLTFGSACTETCNTDMQFACGGKDTENVYYAVNTESQVVDKRVHVFQEARLRFSEARKECVRQAGDLVTLTEASQLETVSMLANESRATGPFWIGLSRTAWRTARRWTVPNVYGLDASDRSVFWAGGQPMSTDFCTVLDPASLTWHSVPCTESHPYVCTQLPATPALPKAGVTSDPTTAPTTRGYLEVESTFWSENKNLVFYLMAPLFLLFFCGSCVAYTINHAYKALHKRRRYRRFSTSAHRPVTPSDVTVDPPPYTRTTKTTHAPAEPEDEALVNDLDIDFTKLSIADILYIRSMLGLRTNKREQIIST